MTDPNKIGFGTEYGCDICNILNTTFFHTAFIEKLITGAVHSFAEWDFKKQISTIYYDTVIQLRALHSRRLFYLHSMVKIQPFFQFSIGGIHG